MTVLKWVGGAARITSFSFLGQRKDNKLRLSIFYFYFFDQKKVFFNFFLSMNKS